MATTIRADIGGATSLATASQTIAANATTAFDFGTPNDINTASLVGGEPGELYDPGDRILLVFSALRAAGTTSTLTYTIQDAPDSAGSIGTPATAVTYGTIPSHAAGTAGHVGGVVAVQVQPGRPWIRVNAVHGVGGTDSFQAHVTVLGVASNA